jgi:hypothetical protein
MTSNKENPEYLTEDDITVTLVQEKFINSTSEFRRDEWEEYYEEYGVNPDNIPFEELVDSSYRDHKILKIYLEKMVKREKRRAVKKDIKDEKDEKVEKSKDDSYTFLDGSKMVISRICYETYPCKHDVILDTTESMCYSARKIIKYFQDRNEKVPEHFQCYMKTFHKKRRVFK